MYLFPLLFPLIFYVRLTFFNDRNAKLAFLKPAITNLALSSLQLSQKMLYYLFVVAEICYSKGFLMAASIDVRFSRKNSLK